MGGGRGEFEKSRGIPFYFVTGVRLSMAFRERLRHKTSINTMLT